MKSSSLPVERTAVRTALTTAMIPLSLTAIVCAQASPLSPPHGTAPQPVTPAPESWERRAGDAYQNRGLAKVERLGDRWVLTTFCHGEHSTYIDLELSKVKPARYARTTVMATYRYVDRVQNVQCLRAPCNPVIERRVALDKLTSTSSTALQVQNATDRCESVSPQ